ncbi:MAG: flagellar hook protein FlgE [Candidatus Marinimicrobia bacterium]|nr:flagellar hook protein FlgE [Candidatus Neomarinimicrobiota bacterium]
MLKSLSSAVSGLKNFTAQLDVLGNNLANVRTIGYKSSRMTFAEARAQSLSGASRGFGGGFGNQKQIGLGVNIATTDINFGQGSLEFTGVPTDMAIQGNSFFILSDGDVNSFSRAGNFFFNDSGFLVNPSGLAVQGFQADDKGEIDIFAPLSEIFLDTNLSAPASETENVFMSGNLDSNLSPLASTLSSVIPYTLAADGSAALAATELNDLTQTATALIAGDTISIDGKLPDGTVVSGTFIFSTDGTTLAALVAVIDTIYAGEATASISSTGALVLTDVVKGDSETAIVLSSDADISLSAFETTQAGFTGQASTSTTVFDSLGEAHNLILTFTLTPTDGKWTWEATFLGDEEITAGGTGTINFNEVGTVVAFNVDGAATSIEVDPGNAAASFSIILDAQGGSGFSGVTQFASDSTLIVREQDGRPTGSLLRFAIDNEGIVTGVFSNEKNLTIAQIALAEFPNPLGLLRAGDGNFKLASGAGTPIIGKAGEQFSATIISGSLENSNVDLVAQFTDMIVTQRGFQANARVVTTADQILEETMRLKR